MPPRPAFSRLAAFLLLCLPGASVRLAAQQQQAPVPPVNLAVRAEVAEHFRRYYGDPASVPMNWTGSLATGEAGEVSEDYRRLTLQRINYFRALSGLAGNVVFDPAGNDRCQQAALMFAAQRSVSHRPPSTWKWWTPDAAAAAAGSDIRCEGGPKDEGPDAVTRFIADVEPNNADVGHRRWLLYPGQTTMASGSVPASTQDWGANTIWVLGPFAPRPAGTPEWTAWPPAGYVPAALVFDRWSFSYRDADFTNARVSLTKNGADLPVFVQPPAYQSGVNGAASFVGDNTLVWEPRGNAVSATADETYTVTVENVVIAGQSRGFTYEVTSLAPNASAEPPPPPGPIPAPAGAPAASLSVKVPVAVRSAGVNAKLFVSLDAPAPADLSVAYTVSGSGERALTGAVGIPAGDTRAKIKVALSAEPTGGAVETVIVALQPGTGYTVNATAGAATVTIRD